MSQTARPLQSISPSADAWFASEGLFVVRQETTVALYSFDPASLETRLEKTISFDGAQILSADSYNDNLFILSGIPSGNQWARKQKRRFHLSDDKWTYEHPLFSCSLRVFSLASGSQVGLVVQFLQSAVQATIRVRGAYVTLRTIGPCCLASIWKAPISSQGGWQMVHQELTWDPDEIAQLRGYQNADEEPAPPQSDEEDEEQEDEEDGEGSDGPLSDRYEWRDRDILDYVFLSETLIARLTEEALDRGEAKFTLEIFEPDASSCSSSAKFGMAGPCLLRIEIGDNAAFTGMTTAFAVRDRSSTHESDIISIMISSSDMPHQICVRASALLAFAANPSSVPQYQHETLQAIKCYSSAGIAPFTRFAQSAGSLELVPSLCQNLVLLPTCDIDSNSRHPESANLRFLDFSDNTRPPKCIDIPLTSVLAPSTGSPNFNRIDDVYSPGPSVVVHSWNGRNALILSFTDLEHWYTRQECEAWLVKLDDSFWGD